MRFIDVNIILGVEGRSCEDGDGRLARCNLLCLMVSSECQETQPIGSLAQLDLQTRECGPGGSGGLSGKGRESRYQSSSYTIVSKSRIHPTNR
jgi:hypothetical protein